MITSDRIGMVCQIIMDLLGLTSEEQERVEYHNSESKGFYFDTDVPGAIQMLTLTSYGKDQETILANLTAIVLGIRAAEVKFEDATKKRRKK